MCGIIYSSDAEPRGDLLAHRGPDSQKSLTVNGKHFVFSRLAINGNQPSAEQPFVSDRWIVCCNGEIFNYKYLGFVTDPNSSDCEILIPMLDIMSFPDMCSKLDAEFAIIVYDRLNDITWVARDRWGVRPLFIGDRGKAVSSEMKGIMDICNHVEQVRPGYWYCISPQGTYTSGSYCNVLPRGVVTQNAFEQVRSSIELAVEKRLMCQNGGVCALLSGGLDSSIVAAIAAKSIPNLKTFSIGMPGSPDLKYAQVVADHIGSDHTTICYEPEVFIQAIPEVIRAIESYDTTTVRASLGNYLVAKYIKENTDKKVVLNGDYSDEVCGGYLYMKLASTKHEFDQETNRLLQNICFFDSLRSDRSICANGLEARCPFADIRFIETYLSFDKDVTSPKDKMEKYGLRKACEDLLPPTVAWRSKEAFSDGVTDGCKKSIAELIEDHIHPQKEDEYYKEIFDAHYGNHRRNVIPYKWMPKWTDAQDPSARTLSIYTKDK